MSLQTKLSWEAFGRWKCKLYCPNAVLDAMVTKGKSGPRAEGLVLVGCAERHVNADIG